jgi:FtsH-binding integral membrane protein
MDTTLDYTDKKEKGLLLTRVFAYMGLGLLVTAVVAVVSGYFFSVGIDANTESGINTYYTSIIIAAISLFILMLLIHFLVMRKGWNMWPWYIAYAVAMGVMLSTFTMFIPYYVLGITFGITCLCFASMAISGYIAKGNLTIVGFLGMGFLVGALGLSLLNVILYFALGTEWSSLYLIVSILSFVGIMLITCFDVWNITKMIASGNMSPNLSLYCAFSLYTDFIYLFIRILYFVMLVLGKSRR